MLGFPLKARELGDSLTGTGLPRGWAGRAAGSLGSPCTDLPLTLCRHSDLCGPRGARDAMGRGDPPGRRAGRRSWRADGAHRRRGSVEWSPRDTGLEDHLETWHQLCWAGPETWGGRWHGEEGKGPGSTPRSRHGSPSITRAWYPDGSLCFLTPLIQTLARRWLWTPRRIHCHGWEASPRLF